MGTATLTLPEDIKSELKRFSWINWSEVAKEELLKKEKKQELLKKLDKLLEKSEMTDKLALELGEKIKESMWKRYKEKGR